MPKAEITMRISDSGEVTIPADVRERAVRLLSGAGTRDLGMSTDEIMKLLRGE